MATPRPVEASLFPFCSPPTRPPVTSPPPPWTPGPSAGIGRTGCFIATRIGCQQLKALGEVDILGIVCQLRLDRWVCGLSGALHHQALPVREEGATFAPRAVLLQLTPWREYLEF